MKTHSTVSKNMQCVIFMTLCSLKKKAKISTRQMLFTPKTLNFDIAKNTSLKVFPRYSELMFCYSYVAGASKNFSCVTIVSIIINCLQEDRNDPGVQDFFLAS